MGSALQQEGPDGAPRPLAFFSRKLSGSQLNGSPREKECYAIVAALLEWDGWMGNKRVEVRTDTVALIIALWRTLNRGGLLCTPSTLA